MAENKPKSMDDLEAEYRAALAKYELERDRARGRVLDLKRARDEALEAMSVEERVPWHRAQMPKDAPYASVAEA